MTTFEQACQTTPDSSSLAYNETSWKTLKAKGLGRNIDRPKICDHQAVDFIGLGTKDMSNSNTLSLSQEAALEAPTLKEPPSVIEPATPTEVPDGGESYERATTLKNVGLFKQAVEHFEKAAQDPAYALKGLAQMGLCLKQSAQLEEAAVAFRKALQVPSATSKEQVQILYLLGRTLESLGRVNEALEAYRWLRREAPQYRDVATRIESLSTRRVTKQF
jgi:tetratricopeptide (TPR) repeat protein